MSSKFPRILAVPRPRIPQTPHQILNLSPAASPTEIKNQYFRLLKETHPDKTLRLNDAERARSLERYEEVRRAYATLTQALERENRPPEAKAPESPVNATVVAGFLALLAVGSAVSLRSAEQERKETAAAWQGYMAARDREGLGDALGYTTRSPRR